MSEVSDSLNATLETNEILFKILFILQEATLQKLSEAVKAVQAAELQQELPFEGIVGAKERTATYLAAYKMKDKFNKELEQHGISLTKPVIHNKVKWEMKELGYTDHDDLTMKAWGDLCRKIEAWTLEKDFQ